MSAGQAAAEAAAATLAPHRGMLFGLAYRLLGSVDDAEDVLQEAYLRWVRADRDRVGQPRRYLSRMVTHLALDRLKARQAEVYVGTWLPEPLTGPAGPADTAEQRESLSIAALRLMERLTPPERAVYVLRTAFDLPYTEIAEILDRSAEHCRQLFHRAADGMATGRRRFTPDPAQVHRILTGFVAAATAGDLGALGRLLHADVVAWSDGGGRVRSARNPVTGAAKVARLFAGIYSRRTPLAAPAVVNGEPALILRYGDRYHVLSVELSDGAIAHVHVLSNPDKIRRVVDAAGSP